MSNTSDWKDYSRHIYEDTIGGNQAPGYGIRIQELYIFPDWTLKSTVATFSL